MKGRPLLPFAIIAVVGILLMISISIIGLNQRAAMDEEGEGADTEEVVEFDDPVEAGEQIVNQSCIGCHGGDLSGGAGPALTGLEGKYSAEEIADIVQNGKGAMPAMPHDDAEADAIAQYLLSIE
ncbi:cytochrome c [Halalkalibacterium halodurans]|jgi:cytochrome c550|uniref:Cytochrome c551 n=2 Tax=Halalkalibacterium halodurans TaxID=86665 RepID=Q9KD41_HALH5|nr:cytochrome c [Halalkalibacterium halodurans]MDY7221903.1 cytochrome c [Halalkalibacterium halodurans]MDY7241179.1 cytochrome c [Halalkalibacterium halodurans]MED4080611.1 cytochrome c [Halalkalibacterium halodurans]MED4083767.1 cytochrome c [Halalkalibacterium halodurans]MED4105404.1 cytochrome c [Halalkalibacterium halodurans]